MAIGDRIQNRFTAYRDIHTGVEVERLTEPGHVSHHMYFYNRMMTEIREALDAGTFAAYKKRKLEGMGAGRTKQGI